MWMGSVLLPNPHRGLRLASGVRRSHAVVRAIGQESETQPNGPHMGAGHTRVGRIEPAEQATRSDQHICKYTGAC